MRMVIRVLPGGIGSMAPLLPWEKSYSFFIISPLVLFPFGFCGFSGHYGSDPISSTCTPQRGRVPAHPCPWSRHHVCGNSVLLYWDPIHNPSKISYAHMC